jgi:hypothetical protein
LEREENQEALRRYAIKRSMPQAYVFAALVVASLVGIVASPLFVAVALVLTVVGVLSVRRSAAAIERRGSTLGADILAKFSAGGTPKDRQRLITVLDRLTATFGVDAVSAFIIDDAGYNAALVANGASYSFFVTSAMMRDFELIELEGVVAHCMARQRLGILARESASAMGNVSVGARRKLAGVGLTYRADEVAAAAIRYPLGLAGALRKCARQVVAPTSFFASAQYDQWRFVWFDVWSDRQAPDLSDLDDVDLRALALEEW